MKTILLPPTLFCICLALMFLLWWVWPIGTLFAIPINLLGLAPLAAGLALSMAGSNHFARIGTTINTFDEPGQLVTDGWFRYSRNPMYLGFALALIGAFILLGAISPTLGVFIFVVAADRWYIPYEEKKMMAKFGEAYQDYKHRVRRWI